MQAHTKARRTSGGMHLTLTDAKGRKQRTALLQPGNAEIVWRMVERLKTETGTAPAKAAADERPPVPWEVVAKEHLKKGGVALSVRAKRKRAGMSQAELAEVLGIKQANVSEIETGKRVVGKDLARRLAKVFSVDYRTFL